MSVFDISQVQVYTVDAVFKSVRTLSAMDLTKDVHWLLLCGCIKDARSGGLAQVHKP